VDIGEEQEETIIVEPMELPEMEPSREPVREPDRVPA
jgi:hypothetical protein